MRPGLYAVSGFSRTGRLLHGNRERCYNGSAHDPYSQRDSCRSLRRSCRRRYPTETHRRRQGAACSIIWASRSRAARPTAAASAAASPPRPAASAEATLIGDGRRVPAVHAALANAISSHSVELDDVDVLALVPFQPAGRVGGAGGRRAGTIERRGIHRGGRRRMRDDGPGERGHEPVAARSWFPYDADLRCVRRDHRGGPAAQARSRRPPFRRWDSPARRHRG